jgi:hypothetical protein
VIAWTVPAAVLLAALVLALADRHRRYVEARDDLAEVRARIRAQARARITDRVDRRSDFDITQDLVGILRATAADERTNNPATGK